MSSHSAPSKDPDVLTRRGAATNQRFTEDGWPVINNTVYKNLNMAWSEFKRAKEDWLTEAGKSAGDKSSKHSADETTGPKSLRDTLRSKVQSGLNHHPYQISATCLSNAYKALQTLASPTEQAEKHHEQLYNLDLADQALDKSDISKWLSEKVKQEWDRNKQATILNSFIYLCTFHDEDNAVDVDPKTCKKVLSRYLKVGGDGIHRAPRDWTKLTDAQREEKLSYITQTRLASQQDIASVVERPEVYTPSDAEILEAYMRPSAEDPESESWREV